MRRARVLAVAAAALFLAAGASDPSERLADQAQEERARALFRETRCVVCQNESIDGSEAEIARDLRLVIREQIVQGRSDDEIRAFLLERYGDFVLFRPRLTAANLLLWGTPFAVVLIGGAALFLRARRKSHADAEPLTPDEEARLAALTAEGEDRHGFAENRAEDRRADDGAS